MKTNPNHFQEAWGLLHRINHPLKSVTIERLFCDYFNIIPLHARDLIVKLIDNDHATNDTGWITLKL